MGMQSHRLRAVLMQWVAQLYAQPQHLQVALFLKILSIPFLRVPVSLRQRRESVARTYLHPMERILRVVSYHTFTAKKIVAVAILATEGGLGLGVRQLLTAMTDVWVGVEAAVAMQHIAETGIATVMEAVQSGILSIQKKKKKSVIGRTSGVDNTRTNGFTTLGNLGVRTHAPSSSPSKPIS
jgi:hypothetical protein